MKGLLIYYLVEYGRLTPRSTIYSIVEFINQDGKEKAMDMFQNYDYEGQTLTIKSFEVV